MNISNIINTILGNLASQSDINKKLKEEINYTKALSTNNELKISGIVDVVNKMFYEHNNYKTFPDTNVKGIGADLSSLESKLNLKQMRLCGYTGKGVKVAVIDNGVKKITDKLNVAGGFDFINNSSTSYLDNITDNHGTYVGSVIAGKSCGIAPFVDLYSLKVKIDGSEDSYNQLIKALDWCLDNKIDIVNISFGFTSLTKDKLEALELKCKKLYDNNITIVSACGNNGASGAGVSYPALFDCVFGIGSTKLDFSKDSNSSYGYGLDFTCFGNSIVAYNISGANTTVNEGTSIACALVSGIVALFKEQYMDLTPREIYEIIKKNANKKHEPKDINFGYGSAFPIIINNEYKKDSYLKNLDNARNLYFKKQLYSVKNGEKINTNVQLLPSNDEFTGIVYFIDNETIASVDSQGVVTGKAVGETILYAMLNRSKIAMTTIKVTA